MDYGKPVRVYVKESESVEIEVSKYSCSVIALICATVGESDLPIDPPPEEPPPEIEEPPEPEPPPAPSVSQIHPTSGPDETQIMLHGANLQAQGPNSAVMVGIEPAMIVSWNEEDVVVETVLGANDPDVPLPVMLKANDGQETTGPDFTFTTSKSKKGLVPPPAAKGSVPPVTVTKTVKAKTDEGAVMVKSKSEPDIHPGKPGVKQPPQKKPEQREQPKPPDLPFPGVMFKSGERIVIGPFELEAGKGYPMNLAFSDGLKVVVKGPVDFTLVMVG